MPTPTPTTKHCLQLWTQAMVSGCWMVAMWLLHLDNEWQWDQSDDQSSDDTASVMPTHSNWENTLAGPGSHGESLNSRPLWSFNTIHTQLESGERDMSPLKQHRQRHPIMSSSASCPPHRQANYLVVKIICHQSLLGLSSHTQPCQWNFLPSLSQTHRHIWPLFMRPPLLSCGTGGDNCYIGSLSWDWWDAAPW